MSVFSKIAIAVVFTALANSNAFAAKVGYVQMKSIMQSQQSLDVGKKLMAEFKFSAIQATAILEMRLQQLANLEAQKIEDELKEGAFALSLVNKPAIEEASWGAMIMEVTDPFGNKLLFIICFIDLITKQR